MDENDENEFKDGVNMNFDNNQYQVDANSNKNIGN